MKRILHIGLGNFHRAHQAWYTQRADGWSITGVSLRSARMRDLLIGQGFNYTLVIRTGNHSEFLRMEVLDDILVAPQRPDAILNAIADPAVQVITVTVTEKGYHLGADGLDLNAPEIIKDLNGQGPATLTGLLAHGLSRRWHDGAHPVTILSCDNLSENGVRLQAAVQSYAQAAELGIDERLGTLATFPNAMVDRITPATTPELADEVQCETGRTDAAPVATEAFSEWIIEDRFAADRPAWETAGARIVSDVAPFEHRKLRLLNGAHSYLAYRGQLRGHTYVHEAISDPVLLSDVKNLMTKAAATLPAASRHDAEAYADALIARFKNAALDHALAQIAMDGTAKIPIRWLPVLAHSSDNEPIRNGLAGWVAHVHGLVLAGEPVNDPREDDIGRICLAHGSATGATEQLLALLANDWPAGFAADIAQRCRLGV